MATPGSILNISTAPGRNHFSVQISRSGDADIITKTCGEIAAGYQEPTYFVPNGANTAVVFHAPADGPKTDNGSGAREELREAGEDGSDNAFNPFDGNMHRFKGTSTITHHPTYTGTSMDNTGITLAQLHNGNEDRLTFRTQFVSGTLRLRYRENGTSVTGTSSGSLEIASGTADSSGTNIWNSSGTKSWQWEMQVYSGNGTTCTADFYINGSLWRRNTAFNNTDGVGTTWYFKAGCYNQFDATKVSSSEYGQVELKSIEHWHTGWATPISGGTTANTSGLMPFFM